MKKILTFILVALLPLVASAYDAEIDGIYYELWSDEAEVTYYRTNNSNDEAYQGDIVIPPTITYNNVTYRVTSIGYKAFIYCWHLNSVTIPNSVTSIGSQAFFNCVNLRSVNIPDGVTSIAPMTFWYCGLTSITIPDGVTSIGNEAFRACTGIRTIILPNSLISIGEMAFRACNGLTSITIPSSLTNIGSDAFQECTGLKKVIVPDIAAWCNIKFAESFYYSSNPLYYAKHLYSDEETEITELTIPNGVKTIRNAAFCGCAGLTNITIPNSVTSIGENTFQYCTGLTTLSLSNSVTNIGERAFEDCKALKSIIIPNKVTTIRDGTFSYCTGLESVTIPSSVSSIGESAFFSCDALKKVIVSDIAAWCNINFYHDISNPLHLAHHLYSDDDTEITDLIIPDGTTTINHYAFSNCSSLTSLFIPNSVTYIDYGAFEGCSSLTSVTIPNNVTKIGGWSFYGCMNLKSITIGSGVTNIESDAFLGCRSLQKVIVPDIAAWCAISCNGDSANPLTYAHHLYSDETTEITNLIIPNDVTTIGEWGFSGCSGLTSITIPESVTQIGYYAFENCSGLTSVTIPESMTSIYDGVFSGCSGLTAVTIPNCMTNVGDFAFNECRSLKDVYCLAENVPTGGGYAFYRSPISSATLHVPAGSVELYKAKSPWSGFGRIVPLPTPVNSTISLGNTGHVTYCSKYALDFSEVNGIKAYIASEYNPSTYTLTLTRVTEVPAGEGLYLVGTPGTYEVPFTETDMMYSNLLKGVTTATTISPTDGDYTNFILGNGSHGVAFYSLSAAGELAAGKAYLQLPTASVYEAKAISVIFDDDEDAVLNIGEESQTQRIYNLQGQQVSAPKSGLYIINGKKVIIK